mmetsp:Transcript_2841/g.5737  ORF Transcript_2841/g.5737 Transcript_2841/m.5737 type:complete len:81 (-) Transcript_2841:56-298(-)
MRHIWELPPSFLENSGSRRAKTIEMIVVNPTRNVGKGLHNSKACVIISSIIDSTYNAINERAPFGEVGTEVFFFVPRYHC